MAAAGRPWLAGASDEAKEGAPLLIRLRVVGAVVLGCVCDSSGGWGGCGRMVEMLYRRIIRG